MFSSDWQVFFGIINVRSLDLLRTVPSIRDSKWSTKQTLGKHNPIEIPGPTSNLFYPNFVSNLL